MMKKIFALLFIVAVCYACGNNNSTASGSAIDSSKMPPKTDDITKNPDYAKGLELISKSNCLTCHKVEETSTGPSYRDVANKYPNTEATLDTLASKVIRGGSGNWGQVPMLAHPELAVDDAKAIVKYIMLLKNK